MGKTLSNKQGSSISSLVEIKRLEGLFISSRGGLRTSDTTWPIVVNQIEHNETTNEETQPAEMEEVQLVNETQAREQLKIGPARARKKPGWLKDFVI